MLQSIFLKCRTGYFVGLRSIWDVPVHVAPQRPCLEGELEGERRRMGGGRGIELREGIGLEVNLVERCWKEGAVEDMVDRVTSLLPGKGVESYGY